VLCSSVCSFPGPLQCTDCHACAHDVWDALGVHTHPECAHQYRKVHNNSVDVTHIINFESDLAKSMQECVTWLTPANYPYVQPSSACLLPMCDAGLCSALHCWGGGVAGRHWGAPTFSALEVGD
jgi:hypothetical protein